MEELQSDGKLKRICDVLRDRTLKPAEKEAEEMLENARVEALRIVNDAKREAAEILENSRIEIASKLEEGRLSLCQSGRRVLDFLKQAVEERFFKPSLMGLLENIGEDPEIVARLIESLILAVEKEGISGNLAVFVSKNLLPRKINELLGREFLGKLDSGGVALGNFAGGLQLKIRDRDVVLDFTSEALQSLLVRFLQKDFREMVFEKTHFEWND